MANISHFTQTVNGVSATYDIHDANAVDLTNNQTVGGNKEFTGTTTAHDVIPSATDTYNFGSPSYQWNNAYIKSLTINGVACGDILTHNVSEFVDVSSNQTIGGVKTFSGSFSVNKPSPRLQTKSTTYSSETTSAMTIGDIAFLNNSGGFSSWIIHQLRDGLTKRLCFRVYPHTSDTYKGFAFDDTCTLYPENTNSALGTSTNKWKSFNGLNPGALSLPNTASPIQLDTTSFDVTATTIGTFASTVDGWAILSMSQKNKPFGIWIISEFYRASFYSVKNNTDYMIFALIPVRANINMDIYCTADDIDSTRKVDWLRLFPCLGNV